MTQESAQARQLAVQFAAEFAYYKANPETRMDVPSIVYENADKAFLNWIEKHEQQPSSAINPFKK